MPAVYEIRTTTIQLSAPDATAASWQPHAIADIGPSTASPVSWQTIFWTLVSLAISSMSQPGGRICGLPARYRTYLRCSPMICAADAVCIFSHLITNVCYARLSLKEAVGTLLHERFRQNPSEHETLRTEGIQSLENMIWLRWIFFLLGTLPPALKLLAIEGIPWTKVWAGMFLFPWVLNEALIIFASFNQSFFTVLPAGQITFPGFERVATSPRYITARTLLNVLNNALAVTAILVHEVAMNGIFRQVYRKSLVVDWKTSYTYLRPDVGGPIGTSFNTFVSFLMGLTIASLGWLPWPQSSIFSSPRHIRWLWYAIPVLTTISIMDGLCYGMLYAAGPVWVTGSAAVVHLVASVQIVLFVAAIGFVSRRFETFGRNILVLNPSLPGERLKVDYVACLALTYVLFTLVSCLFWYCYLANLEDTVEPAWAGVFGRDLDLEELLQSMRNSENQ